ncbi:hypothetical protein P175DRAFT_0126077 [Aspergillus ochraceoroseus IBT 24754]|uniref:Uncharacterized protein n=1 Tax=Aspergillus ochraceoroseus IBT 24754 TaxID=1392256 RepID=A0A2T5M131_9EURO|nr:uncharacterized protein P175DRAFT_0126077 [Aspergillus ochraceoroseus IBT 24754]PTU22241.1 hypothetical protein P175DRAFT_0126077 [Aspergillus ochraceoroseus IBT 24754]
MSALPRQILLHLAELALKSLQAWCFGSEVFVLTSFRQRLDHESKELLDICQGLRLGGYSSAKVLLLNENSLLNEHTRYISDMLHDDIILKLALLTWYFDSTSQFPSEKLLNFFAHPHDKVEAVCEALFGLYTLQTGEKISYHSFRAKLLDTLGYVEYLVGDVYNLMLE